MPSDQVSEDLRGLYDSIPEITEEQAQSARLVCAGAIKDKKHLSQVLSMLGLAE